jgi:hypothetical protein
MTRLPLHRGLRRLPGRALLLVVAAAGAAACGPSFQAVYEGDVHFEHCYATDQRNVSPDVKKECWRDWLRGYTYGQSNDRVEYAATRFSQLSLDPTLPSEEVPGSHSGSHKPEHTVAAPVPTNAFAPPPIVNNVDREKPDASAPPPERHVARASLPPSAPGTDCVAACEERWSSCRSGCKDGACDACDHTYRACAPACFHDEAGAPRTKTK